MMNINGKKRNGIVSILLVLIAVALCFSISAAYIGIFGISAEGAKEPAWGKLYYAADYSSKEESKAAAKALAKEIEAEGITLLKNEEGALPLSSGAKISLFSKHAYGNQMNYDGKVNGTSASSPSSLNGNRRVELIDALSDAGFSMNPNLETFYNNNTLSGNGHAEVGYTAPNSKFATGETPVENFALQAGLVESFSEYNDAAIVVISRTGGEGTDLARVVGGNPGARGSKDHYLQLDANEANLIKYVGDRFEKVIVLLNMGTSFECGFLDDPNHYGYHENVVAALNIGAPGAEGTKAIADVLLGKINPSGKTVDTYARDFKKDPTWQNMGTNDQVGTTNTYDGVSTTGGFFNAFVEYEEGIYVGYRYWETRGFTEGTEPYTWEDAYYNSTATGMTLEETDVTYDNWYDAHVVYPFGYGLSYTTFTQEIVSSTDNSAPLTEDGEISITVKVTNTGNVAGKEVVQLYQTAPYYNGGIEKAHVVLVDFAKTAMLEPRESENVTITIDVRDLASYDYSDANANGFTGYEVEAGEYELKIMKNSHEMWDSVTYTVPESASTVLGKTGFTYATDEVTGTEIENRFDDVSWGDDESNALVYMSRSNFEGTFPKAPTAAEHKISDELEATIMEWSGSSNGSSPNDPADDPSDPWYNDEPVTFDADNGLLLKDMVGLAYDDPLWDDFLDQLSIETDKSTLESASDTSVGINNMIRTGNWQCTSYPTLGVPFSRYEDGPAGLKGNNGSTSNSCTVYPNDTMLASTWNKDIAYRKGVMLGNEGLFGNDSGKILSGGYSPAINIHRSQFSGRNFEYFSEDPIITGKLAGQQVAGGLSKGFISFVKHFAVNDQETNRAGISTWASEQSLREIYLKAFEIVVKEGGANAIMTSFNRLGAVWAGGHYGLMTEVLRDEWGFRGMVLTDYINSRLNMCNIDQALRAGGDIMLHSTSRYIKNYDTNTVKNLMRNAAHNILYTVANSNAMNQIVEGYKEPSNPVADVISYTDFTMNAGAVGGQYNGSVATATFKDVEGFDIPADAQIEYRLKNGSRLPAGLVLNSDGTVTGRPSETVNNWEFIVVASYSVASKEAKGTISIVEGNSVVYSAPDLDTAYINEAYTADIATATHYEIDETVDPDERPEITYALKTGSALPEGLTLSSDGKITGTPVKVCSNYAFTVVASAEGYADAEAELKLTINGKITADSKPLKNAKFGVGYVARLAPAEAENGREVTYSAKDPSQLPDGMSITAGGYLVGTPTEVVTDREFVVVISEKYSLPVEVTYNISVGITYTDMELSSGEAGEEYEFDVAMANGTGSIKYSVTEGTLPEGLTLSEDGIISGTPAKAGVYTFVVTASADGYIGDSITLKLYIA